LATKILKIRSIVEIGKKKITGPVLYSDTPIAFLQGVDPEKGYVSDTTSQIFGKPFRKKILVFPNAVGSSVGAYVIYRLKKNGNAPFAMVNKNSDIISASGCALAGIPLFDFESAPGSFDRLSHSKRVIIDVLSDSIRLP
jgi:uncharacterized protein